MGFHGGITLRIGPLKINKTLTLSGFIITKLLLYLHIMIKTIKVMINSIKFIGLSLYHMFIYHPYKQVMWYVFKK